MNEEAWKILGLIVAFVVQTIGLAKFLIVRLDDFRKWGEAEIAEERTERRGQSKDIYDKMTEIRRDYVRRDDLDRTVARFDESLKLLRQELQRQGSDLRDHDKRMNARIDLVSDSSKRATVRSKSSRRT